MTRGFHVGGAVHPDALYVERPADRVLRESLGSGRPCVVLGPRQLGKSSLCHRTAASLRECGRRVAVVDCAALGAAEATADGWLYGLAEEIAGAVHAADPAAHWDAHPRVPPVRRFVGWLAGLLAESPEPVVLLLDEVDVVKTLPFGADEVLGALRSTYDARSRQPVWDRFCFALVGVASPATLGSDPGRTPVNVATEVALADFTRAQAEVLAVGLEGLGADPEALLDAVLHWTSGHPWMTQRLCDALARGGASSTQPRARVDQLVGELFVARGALSDVCLLASSRQLLADPQAARLLGRYGEVLDGRAGGAREGDVDLLLTGMVAQSGGELQVRNAIFGAVFDRRWVDDRASRRPLATATQRWTQTGRRDVDVLRGRAFEEASSWAASRVDLTPDESALLLRSAEVAREETLAQERMRSQRARFRLAATALGVVLVALLFTGWAWLGQARAVRVQTALRTADEARLLAAIPGEQRRALRLALDALWQQERPETVHALVEVLHAAAGVRSPRLPAPASRVACLDDVVLAEVDGVVWQLGGASRWHRAQRAWPSPAGALPWDVVFEPEGHVRLSSVDGPPLVLWGHHDVVLDLDLSPDGGWIATGGDENHVMLWDAATARPLGRFLQHEGSVRHVAFCGDGRTVVSASDDRTVGIWRAFGGLAEQVVDGARWVATSDAGELAWAGADGARWGERAARPLAGGDFESVHVTADGSAVVASNDDPELVVIWPASGEIFAPPGWVVRWPGPLSADGRRLAAQDGTSVGVWDLAARAPLQRFDGLPADVWSAVLSPDGRRLVATFDGGAQLLDVETGRLVGALRGHDGVVPYAVFSPDGSRVVTVGWDATARLFDAATGEPLHVLQGHQSRLPMAAFSPDGSQLVTPSYDGSSRLWDVATGELSAELPGHAGLVRVAAFSPDGTRVATGGDDGDVRLFETSSGALLATLRSHRSPVRSLAFLDGGRRMASADADQVVVQPVTVQAWRTLACRWSSAEGC
ncbi:MAG: AAA-like domain-containing protein [Myxococcales bacterium]|nr:AAA-like domain-containing protein [Myxococcales bacterium]